MSGVGLRGQGLGADSSKLWPIFGVSILLQKPPLPDINA